MRDVVVFSRDPEFSRRFRGALQDAFAGAEIRDADTLEDVRAISRERAPSIYVVGGPDAAGRAVDVMAIGAARSRLARLVVLGGRANGSFEGGVRILASDTGDQGLVEACSGADAGDASSLGDLSLESVLRVAHATSWSGSLGLRTSGRSGVLNIRVGNVIEASFGDRRGDAAVIDALTEPVGTLCLLDAPMEFGGAVESELDSLVERAAVVRRDAPEPATPRAQESDAAVALGEPPGEGFSLFSDEELAELALDDSMAIPLLNQRDPGSRKR